MIAANCLDSKINYKQIKKQGGEKKQPEEHKERQKKKKKNKNKACRCVYSFREKTQLLSFFFFFFAWLCVTGIFSLFFLSPSAHGVNLESVTSSNWRLSLSLRFFLASGTNGRVTYGVSGEDGFSIDPTTGVISTTKALDRETQELYTVTGTA